MKAKIFYLTMALVLATGLAVAAVPSVSVQADGDRDSFQVWVNENGQGPDYTYTCTLAGDWITHTIDLIDIPETRSLTGVLLIKIENDVAAKWSGFDTYGQLAVDWAELWVGEQVVDFIDIGNLASEAGHLQDGWGPIEPDNSGGYYGGFGPPGEGTGEDCRCTWSSYYFDDDMDWARITLDAGGATATKLVLRVLDGMTGTPPAGDVCFIATAAYGTSTAEEIDTLRAFRDEVLLQNSLGSQLVEWYYQTSPPVADFISENSLLRTIVRELVIDPMVSLAKFTQGIWGD